jgi:hypothetical protein
VHAISNSRNRKDYNIILRLPPIESLEKKWQDIASSKDINHQSMHTHPLHHQRQAPITTNINLWKTHKMSKLNKLHSSTIGSGKKKNQLNGDQSY